MNTFLQKPFVAAASLLVLAFFVVTGVLAQSAPKSQEISDVDGKPVLLQHLPDYESVQARAVFGTDPFQMESVVGNHPVLAILERDFPLGTEYVTAVYPQGRLLIVEFTNPQSSVETDKTIQQFMAANTHDFVYRRIGNYNAFVFGTTDAVAAGELLDQVKYQKTVQWLGEDPYILKRLERYMVTTSKDIMVSTVLVIVYGLGVSILAGLVAGFIFFRVRDQRRAGRAAFSDAGGLTRLNLDGLSE